VPAYPLGLVVRATSGVSHSWLASAVEMAAIASGNWPLSPEPGPGSWTRFPRVAVRTPAADPRSIRLARDFTAATLQRWGITQRCGDIAIVVSELLTNALRHGLSDSSQTGRQSSIRFGLLQPGPSVLCAVADPSSRAPVPKDPGLCAESGRGLHVVAALADAWGYTTPSDIGKVVWAMFSTDCAAATAPGCSRVERAARDLNPESAD
jgi:anti-sigma regulatory factor (Ser/Thr protein kinase)